MKHFAGRATSSMHEGYNAASQRRERPAGDRRCGWLLCSVRSRSSPARVLTLTATKLP
jgi:hypothetical protein